VKLYFLRHGNAESRDDWKGDDAERPLTSIGRDIVAHVAEAMAGMDLGIGLVVASPLRRATETAEIAARALGLLDSSVQDRRAGPGFDADILKALLAEHGGKEAYLFIGHEPDLSKTIGSLIGGGRVTCKKGSLACVKVKDPTSMKGELDWLLPPAILSR
jgi:phosphohistidine phosphatase